MEDKFESGTEQSIEYLMQQLDEQTFRLKALEAENRKLKTESDRFRLITKYMNDGLFIINSDGTYDYFNEQAYKMTQEPEKIIKVGDSLVHSTYYDIENHILGKDELPSARALKGETLDNVIIRVERKGFSGYYSYNGCPIYNESGMLTSAIICFRDITKTYEYEQKIRENEMQLRLASEGANVGIFAFDFQTSEGIWSPKFNLIHGLKEDEPVPLNDDYIFTGLHPEDSERFMAAINAANNPSGDGVADVEYRIILQDGSTRWLRTRGQTHFTGEGKNRRPVKVGGAVTDITDRVAAENNIRKLSEELRNIIESTDDFIWSVDKDYHLLYFNTSFKNFFEKGFGTELHAGINLDELFYGEDSAVWRNFYERAMTDGKFQVDLRSPIDDRMFSLSLYTIYVNSEIIEITCFGKDLTERMKTEQMIVSQNAMLESIVKERTAELQQMVKNLQNFSLALSHDVKASYRDIELCANNIVKHTDIDENAARILQVSKNMTSFIHEIMKYELCTRRTLVKEKVNIKKIFTSVYKELKNNYSNQSQLAFATGFPAVLADRILLQQVVYNVLSNALKFSAKSEPATITVGCKEENNEYVIYVEDNGIGFDMKYVSKLYNAFERLHDKDDYEGNGLGLTIVKNIIQRHGGRTWIESEIDVRTVVYFSLPI